MIQWLDGANNLRWSNRATLKKPGSCASHSTGELMNKLARKRKRLPTGNSFLSVTCCNDIQIVSLKLFDQQILCDWII